MSQKIKNCKKKKVFYKIYNNISMLYIHIIILRVNKIICVCVCVCVFITRAFYHMQT